MQKQGENILDFTFKASEKKFALHCNGLGKKSFYIRGTISPLAEILPLYHDWLRSLNKGYIFELQRKERGKLIDICCTLHELPCYLFLYHEISYVWNNYRNCS